MPRKIIQDFAGFPVIGAISIYLIFSLAFLLSELSVFIPDFCRLSCYRSYQYLSDIFPGFPVIGAISIYLIFSLA
jgi:hypothetical protein